MGEIAAVIVIFSSLVVYLDAKKLGIKKETLPGFIAGMGPVGWFIACLAVWILYFPAYLLKRPSYCRALNQTGSKWFNVFGIGCLAAMVLVLILSLIKGAPIHVMYQTKSLSCAEALPHLKQAIADAAKEHGFDEAIQQFGPSEEMGGALDNEYILCKAPLVTAKDHYTVEYKVFWGNKERTEVQATCEIK